ncbi:MAG: hypothetical protein AB8B53_11285 [Flavobacteriales bacterium]
MKQVLIFLSITFYCAISQAQTEGKTQTFFSPRYTFHQPGGDMGDRFGNFHGLGVTFGTKRLSKLYLGVNVNFNFGNNVNEPGLIQNLLSADGEIISLEGRAASVLIQQRGFNFSGDVGKFFRFKNATNESGILATFGVGFLQHNIRFEHQIDDVPQLDEEYKKGYDRLSNGLMISQNVGWMFFSKKRFGDWYIGVELIEGFTQSRREYNIDTGTSDLGETRLDIMLGFKVGWVVPFYKRNLYN